MKSTTRTRFCTECSLPLADTRSNSALTCSAMCYTARAKRLKQEERLSQPRALCSECGSTVPPDARPNALTCSPACNSSRQRDQKKGRQLQKEGAAIEGMMKPTQETNPPPRPARQQGYSSFLRQPASAEKPPGSTTATTGSPVCHADGSLPSHTGRTKSPGNRRRGSSEPAQRQLRPPPEQATLASPGGREDESAQPQVSGLGPRIPRSAGERSLLPIQAPPFSSTTATAVRRNSETKAGSMKINLHDPAITWGLLGASAANAALGIIAHGLSLPDATNTLYGISATTSCLGLLHVGYRAYRNRQAERCPTCGYARQDCRGHKLPTDPPSR